MSVFFSVAYDLVQYASVRQDGGRTVPHPIGIEPPIHAKTPSGDLGTTAWTGNEHNADNEVEVVQKVPWRSTPPASVVYHDHAWWHEKEVCQPLPPIATTHISYLALGSMGRGLKGRLVS
jgi:hypothetical protein